MHELSIALSILDVASEEAMRRGVDVVAVHVKVGPLSGVVPEALESAYELAREEFDFSLPSSRLVIEQTPLIAHCPTCDEDQKLASPQMLCCPVCGAPTPDVISGRELDIAALEVLDVPANATR
jgi:hydrogenase nickel incorporation protein HypA/HybF